MLSNIFTILLGTFCSDCSECLTAKAEVLPSANPNTGLANTRSNTGVRRSVLMMLYFLITSVFLSQVYANEVVVLNDLVFIPAALSGEESNKIAQEKVPVHFNVHPSERSAANTDYPAKIGEYEKRILEIEEHGGPYSPELIEVMHALGSDYLQLQMFEEARDSFAKVEYINRIHFGLFSENLIPSVKAQIFALDKSGRKNEALEKQQYLLYLLQKCYGSNDPRLIPDFIAYADWNRKRFNEIVRLEVSGLTLLNSSGFSGTEVELREKAFFNLDLAAQHYARAVSILVKNKQWHDPALYQLENRLVESVFLQANRRAVLEKPDQYLTELNLKDVMYSRGDYARLSRDAYQYGIESYKRQLNYISNDPGGSVERYVETLLAFGDWYLLFGKSGASQQKYREAYDLLASLDSPGSAISEILMPEIPVPLPTFTATTQSAKSAALQSRGVNPYQGYIDVSFKINNNGHARSLEVLQSSKNTAKTIERRLLKTIARSQFRPRFYENKKAVEDQIALRYYYTY